jgi:transglutaminase-like putative cysteine protease
VTTDAEAIRSVVRNRLPRQEGGPPPEDSIALRVAVLIAVMASGTAVLRAGVSSPVMGAACVVGIPAAYAFSHVTRHRDDVWLKGLLAAGLLVAFGRFLATMGGVDAASLAEAQIPLAELFLWVQILHSLHVPARRDLMFSVASSVTLIAVAGVLSTSLDVGLHLAVWLVAFVTSLLLAHRRELAELPVLGARGAAPTPVASAARPIAKQVGAITLVLVVLATAVFLVVPAAGARRSFSFPARLAGAVPVPGGGGALSNPSLGDADPGRAGSSRTGEGRASFGYFGFTDKLDLGVRGRPDDTLVMKVRAPGPDFWRGQTFDVWDGRNWTLSDDRPRAVRGERPLQLPPLGSGARVAGQEFVQTYYVERPGPNLVFAANEAAELWFPDNIVFVLSDGTIRAAVEMGEDAVYTVVSRRLKVTADLLRRVDNGQIRDEVRQRYTQLPDLTDRVRGLAQSITANAPTTYDKVRAIEAWLGANTEYSLDIPPLPRGADAVDRFLFVDKIGFCEQIGTAMVVMLRSLGIPARLAAGYAPGERNPFTGLFEVRAHDAHAWAEVWFPVVGWQGFDPTASVPLAGDSATGAAGAGLASYLGRHLPRPSPWLAPLAAAVAVGVALVVTVRRRQAERRLPWPRRYLARLEAEGAKRGRPRAPNETPLAYARALAQSVLPDRRLADDVAAVLDAEAYSGEATADAMHVEAERVLAEVTARWPS